MDLQTLKGVADVGLGPLAFLALMYGGFKVWKFMDLLVNNHLTHIQASLEELSANTKDTSSNMKDLTEAIKELARK